MIKKGLIIAGFDPSAGAGLLMDIKVFSVIGIYASAVSTAIVIENADTVKDIIDIKASVVKEQLKIILESGSNGISGVKIGMLYSTGTAKVIREIIEQYGLRNIVLDPILSSSGGKPLLKHNALDYIRTLFPLCTIITPNINEASVITGVKIKNKDDMILSARYFIDRGVQAVVIKGGHFIRKGLDLYMDKRRYVFLEGKIIHKDVHGTGCIMSTAITSFLIKGYGSLDAVKFAKKFTEEAMKKSFKPYSFSKRYVGKI